MISSIACLCSCLILILEGGTNAFAPVIQTTWRRSSLLQSSIPVSEDGIDSTTTIATTNDEHLNPPTTKKKKKYVIVGGGWGGWGAAEALVESGIVNVDVTLIDALSDPTGSTPYLSPSGKPVEAGTRGFWKDYPNINALISKLGLNENDVFTPYTNSSFYSPDGLEATAPVFGDATVGSIIGGFPFVGDAIRNLLDESSLATTAFPNLPSPLGQVLATIPYFERLPLEDRASMVGLLVATVDCLGGDEKMKASYDRMTAHELFLRFRLSDRLVSDFIKPTLLVGLFKPPEELSALVVMELLYYYALAHQDSFDVRWIKNGTVADSLIRPLAQRLINNDGGGETKNSNGLKVLGGCRVKEISLTKGLDGKLHASRLTYQDTSSGKTEVIDEIDGIILALGCQGMQSVISSSPDLARLPVFSKAASLKGIDVISCRLYFDRRVATRSPANVFSRFDELRGAGGTFFMLDQFQKDNIARLWGKDGEEDVDESMLGSVVACDFYNAGGLMSLKDEDIVSILTKDLLPSAVSKFADAKLIDSWVGKYYGTVSWFSPGSYSLRPPLEGAGNDILPNIKCAGDWVRMGDREHGAKGLCQERAYVSGFEAANSLMKVTTAYEFREHEVLPVREDELQFKVGVDINRKVMSFLPRFWTR